MQSNPVVVLGLSPGGLYLVRALSDAGVQVYGVTCTRESGRYSKYLRAAQVWMPKDESQLYDYIAGLNKSCAATPVLFPASDRFMEWISLHFERLKTLARFSDSYHPDRVQQLLDKDRFYQGCEESGVPFPQRIGLSDSISAAGRQYLQFPVLVKPGRLHEVSDIMKSRKVYTCANAAELRRLADRLPVDRGGWLVQEIVLGPDHDIFCLGGVHLGDGKIVSPISGRKLRQFPAGYGTAAALHIETPPEELWQYTRTLLTHLKVDGLFEIEFKRDAKDGVWKVFEINARTALWFGAARAAGLPLAESAYSARIDAEGFKGEKPPEEAQKRGCTNVIWRTGLKNAVAVLSQLVQPGRSRYKLTGSRSSSAWAFWEPADPLPMIVELFSYFGKIIKRIKP